MRLKDEMPRSTVVVCPFYRKETQQVIYCEGIEKNTATHLAFGSRTALKKYRFRYCCDTYGKCRIAKMLFEKWEEE